MALRAHPIAIVYFVMALAASFMSASITPPFQIADEQSHFYYAEAVSRGTVLPLHIPPDGWGGAYLPHQAIQFWEIFEPVASTRDRVATPAEFGAAATLSDNAPVLVTYTNTALYPPVAYLVSGAVLAVSNALGLPISRAFYVGRLANALLYSLVTAAALAVLPFARSAVAAMLLLPMATIEAGSFSADMFAIAGSALLCALLARWAMSTSRPHWAALAAAAVLAACLAATKLPLIVLALPLAAIAARQRLAAGVALFALVCAAVIAWVTIFAPVSGYVHNSDHSPVGQVSWMLHHPLEAISTLALSMSEGAAWYGKGMVGILGWGDMPLSAWFYVLAGIACGLAALSAFTAPVRPSVRIRLACLLGAAIGVVLVFAALYIGWTSVGAPRVAGVQGRYFLPLLPLLLIGLSGWVRLPAGVSTSLGIAAMSLWGVSTFHVAMALVTRYYIG